MEEKTLPWVGRSFAILDYDSTVSSLTETAFNHKGTVKNYM